MQVSSKSRFSKQNVSQYDEGDKKDEEVEDYLSMCFEDPSTEARKKKQKTEDKQETHTKRSLKELEDEARRKAMTESLGVDNKGYQLLAKFGGFQPGKGLGKTGEGITEPISVTKLDVKEAHFGVGVREEILRKEEKLLKEHEQSSIFREQLSVNYKSSIRFKARSRHISNLVKKAEKIVKTLDSAEGRERHGLWPKDSQEESRIKTEDEERREEDKDGGDENEVEDVDQDVNEDERLRLLLEYLRSHHLYCLYCGCKFNDIEDMNQSCPGIDEDDH